MKYPVDIVDEHDVPTGKVLNSDEADRLNLPHRCVAVFVFSPDGELYVQVHKKSNGKLDHTVGGHVDAGEDYATAAKREMEEEIGLSGVELKEIITGLFSSERTRTHLFGIYECMAPSSWTFKPNEEVDEIYPMKLEEVVRTMNATPDKFTGGFINTMAKFLELKHVNLLLEHAKITKDWSSK